MERAGDQQQDAMAERVRRALAEFVPPEGADAAEVARLRGEVERLAMFDPSKEATLARQYEAAAERGFYRALKELRAMDRQEEADHKAAHEASVDEMVGSILESTRTDHLSDDEFDKMCAEMGMPMPPMPSKSTRPAPSRGGVDVPISIGRRP